MFCIVDAQRAKMTHFRTFPQQGSTTSKTMDPRRNTVSYHHDTGECLKDLTRLDYMKVHGTTTLCCFLDGEVQKKSFVQQMDTF